MSELKFLHITNKGMAFDPQTGDSFQLTETGKMILEQMQDQIPQDEIINKMVDTYAIPVEEALTDYLEFSLQLKVLGIIP